MLGDISNSCSAREGSQELSGILWPARQDHARQGLSHHPQPASKAGRGLEGSPETRSSGKCVMMKQV